MYRIRSTVRLPILILAVGALVLAACGDDGDGGDDAAGETGPFTIWYSNNEAEIEWGEAQVDAWNEANPDEEISAQEIPAGDTSEEVITAAISAGNAPCLIYNIAPAAVPMFERQGGLVSLSEFDDGEAFITDRLGDDLADQYRSPDGGFYQLPWKANPVMIFYNAAAFEEAGIDSEDPPLASYDEFLETSRTLVDSGAVEAAIWPSPANEFFQPWFDFYPLFASATGGTQLVEDGAAQFDSDEGRAAAEFWATLYDEGLSPQEAHSGDAFAEGASAMAIAGPWAITAYDDLDWGVAPVPTPDGAAAEEVWTFSDAKSVSLFTACETPGSAWEFLKETMGEEADGDLLEITGQMPMRADLVEDYPEAFEGDEAYAFFADQNERTVEVPNVPNSIEMWQEFRDAYSASVIFGEQDVDEAMTEAAEAIEGLVDES